MILVGLHASVEPFVSSTDAAAATEVGPRIELITTRHDFGRVQVGSVLRKEFTVRNSGSQRVVLYGEGCGGCSGVALESIIIPPHGRVQIPVTVETAGHCGPLQQVMAFTTSDPQRSRIEFVLIAEVGALDP